MPHPERTINALTMAKTELKKLIISSSFENVQKVEPYLKDLQQQIRFNNDDFNRIMLTLSEATTNAIVHGNKENSQKEVIISSFLDDNTLLISVKDEGEGFDQVDLPDPLKEENLLREGGRGVYLIEQYADHVTYSENGTRVDIEFELDRT